MSEGNHDVSADDVDENSKRSERKRQREKQRRSDLTSAFEELSELILKIEPGVLPVEQGKKKKKTTDGSDALSSGMTRLDIVARTVEVVKTLHEENEKNKRLLEEMKRPGVQRDDKVRVLRPNETIDLKNLHFHSVSFLMMKVLVMVPTLTLVDDQPSTAGRGAPPPHATAQPYDPRYSYPYHHGPHAFAPTSTAFAPSYFAPTSMGHQRRPNWDSGSPNHAMESRGMYPPPVSRDSHGNHSRPPQFYDYAEYARRSESRNSDDHSLQSDRSLSPKAI
jgi:hypothetical protein